MDLNARVNVNLAKTNCMMAILTLCSYSKYFNYNNLIRVLLCSLYFVGDRARDEWEFLVIINEHFCKSVNKKRNIYNNHLIRSTI